MALPSAARSGDARLRDCTDTPGRLRRATALSTQHTTLSSPPSSTSSVSLTTLRICLRSRYSQQIQSTRSNKIQLQGSTHHPKRINITVIPPPFPCLINFSDQVIRTRNQRRLHQKTISDTPTIFKHTSIALFSSSIHPSFPHLRTYS